MTPQELKNSILQMAIQGKLVEQRAEEGTGKAFFEQVQTEKNRLINEGQYKKEKPYSTNIAYKDHPFEIPESWCFVRFGELMISRDAERIPVSTSERAHRAKKYDYYGASGVIDKIDDFLFDEELLLIGEDGANLLSRSTPIAFIASGKYWVNNHAHVLGGCAGLYLPYIAYYINAISLAPYVSGTAQPKMNQENMNAIWVALPPLAEQRRIVAKIESLLPLIDRYEKAWTRLEEFNKRFPGDMQKSLLQMAIQGKLVEQRPEEGTGEELYRQIQQEKARLVREGRIKNEKPYSTNAKYDDYPFDIPESWRFVRFGELMISRDSERIPVSTSDRAHRAKIYDYYGASGVIDKIDDYLFDKELLLIGEDGANLLSRSTPIAFIAKGKYWVNNHAHVLDGCCDLYLKYICYYINGISLAPYVSGTAQPKMNQENMNAIWIALPPLAEQKRIVARLEELLPLCERLK